MTQILFKLRPESSKLDKEATLGEIAGRYENKPYRMFSDYAGLEDIYDVNILNIDETIINQISSMPHVEFCELPPIRQI